MVDGKFVIQNHQQAIETLAKMDSLITKDWSTRPYAPRRLDRVFFDNVVGFLEAFLFNNTKLALIKAPGNSLSVCVALHSSIAKISGNFSRKWSLPASERNQEVVK